MRGAYDLADPFAEARRAGRVVSAAAETAAEAAAEAAEAIALGRSIAPFSERGRGVTVEDAYRAVAELGRRRGLAPRGRKIGFSNRGIWPRYGVDRPIWGPVYAATLFEIADLGEGLSLDGLVEPRLEPEIALGLKAAPATHMNADMNADMDAEMDADMDFDALAGCVDWVAPAFEVVQSIYPGWRFDVADCVLAGALHGRLALGPRIPAADIDLRALPTVGVRLLRGETPVEDGVGANALDGPIQALGRLVALLGSDDAQPPLAAGEIVSTGTLTDAQPITPGETWRAAYSGVLPAEIRLAFR